MTVKPAHPPAQAWAAAEPAIPTNTLATTRELALTEDAMNAPQTRHGQRPSVTATAVHTRDGGAQPDRPRKTVTRAAPRGENTESCRVIATRPALRCRARRVHIRRLSPSPAVPGPAARFRRCLLLAEPVVGHGASLPAGRMTSSGPIVSGLRHTTHPQKDTQSTHPVTYRDETGWLDRRKGAPT